MEGFGASILLLVILSMAYFIGGGFKEDSISNDIKAFGKTKLENVIYECKSIGEVK